MIIKKVFVPRFYTTPDGNSTTIQKLGWKVNLEKGLNNIVHYCNDCQCQRPFILTKEIKKISKKGYEYTSGYMGYCTFCFGVKQPGKVQ